MRDKLGNVARRDEYDAFGLYDVQQDGPWRSQRWGGAHGYLQDPQTGFILCGARFYLPWFGRFLNQDPIGHQGGLNLYAYCEDDPLKNVDPEGTEVQRNAVYAPFPAMLSKYR